jgi:hypothetical protein
LLTGKKATASCFFSVTQSRNGMCFTRQQAAPALPPEYTTTLSYRLFQGVCQVWHFPVLGSSFTYGSKVDLGKRSDSIFILFTT